jgi:hypothetical protein
VSGGSEIVWSGFSNDLSEEEFDLPISVIFFVNLIGQKTTRTIKLIHQ